MRVAGCFSFQEPRPSAAFPFAAARAAGRHPDVAPHLDRHDRRPAPVGHHSRRRRGRRNRPQRRLLRRGTGARLDQASGACLRPAQPRRVRPRCRRCPARARCAAGRRTTSRPSGWRWVPTGSTWSLIRTSASSRCSTPRPIPTGYGERCCSRRHRPTRRYTRRRRPTRPCAACSRAWRRCSNRRRRATPRPGAEAFWEVLGRDLRRRSRPAPSRSGPGAGAICRTSARSMVYWTRHVEPSLRQGGAQRRGVSPA